MNKQIFTILLAVAHLPSIHGTEFEHVSINGSCTRSQLVTEFARLLEKSNDDTGTLGTLLHEIIKSLQAKHRPYGIGCRSHTRFQQNPWLLPNGIEQIVACVGDDTFTYTVELTKQLATITVQENRNLFSWASKKIDAMRARDNNQDALPDELREIR